MDYDPSHYPECMRRNYSRIEQTAAEYARANYPREEKITRRSARHYRVPNEKRNPIPNKSPDFISRFAFVAGALLVLGVIAFALKGGFGSALDSQTTSQKSTPQSEWTVGTMPSLYQKEDPWKDHPYAGSTFSESGCGPISLAMVNIFLTGDKQTSPTALADYATTHGYASDEGTAWAFMVDGATHLGLRGESISLSEEAVRTQLSQGNPIICIMGRGNFTTTGHFIVLAGLDPSGKIVIRDSNSPERTAKVWDFGTIQSQCLEAWAYSA